MRVVDLGDRYSARPLEVVRQFLDLPYSHWPNRQPNTSVPGQGAYLGLSGLTHGLYYLGLIGLPVHERPGSHASPIGVVLAGRRD